MIQTLVIYAPNVGGGGGLVLLRQLLRAPWPAARVVAILDRRGEGQLGAINSGIEVHWAKSSLRGRWQAEALLAQVARAGDTILCFHNLPPVLATEAKVLCYVQNAYLVDLVPKSDLNRWVRGRLAIERMIARVFRRRVHRYIVQTATMAMALRAWYGADAPPIDILPFVSVNTAHDPAIDEPGATRQRWDFIYVSDGSAHKNHRQLFAAWKLLAEEGLHPSVAVTLHPGRDAELHKQVEELAREGLQVEDLGVLPHHEIIAAYRQSGALIFPSYSESFGLPLIEAEAAGLPILAPELDYVRDVCEPAVTFDPHSARSITRAVRRFLELPGDHHAPMSPTAFAQALGALADDGNV